MLKQPLFQLTLSALCAFLMGYFWLKGDDTQNPIEQIKYYGTGFIFFVLGMANLMSVLDSEESKEANNEEKS